jgi:hypothetical protein
VLNLAFSVFELLLEYLCGANGEVGEEDGDSGCLGGEGDGGEGHVPDGFDLERILTRLQTEDDDALLGVAPQQEVAVVTGE